MHRPLHNVSIRSSRTVVAPFIPAEDRTAESHAMLDIVRSLVRARGRCGVCLFTLERGAKSLKIDVDSNPVGVFYVADYHEFTSEALAESAARGCGHCQQIARAFRTHQVQFTEARWWPPRDFMGASAYLELDSNVKFELNVAGALEKSAVDATHACMRSGRRVGGSTRDEACLDQVAAWLDSCRRDHGGCGTSTGFTPTRLLFLDEAPETVRLVESVPPRGAVYAALSHRWTEETLRVRLERDNHAQRLEGGIPLDHFPQMMRDVIFLLRRLGISYVWIDCMCIVQDDKDDWRREAATMASIYANAELTVAASWCGAAGQSLFSGRDGDDFAQVDVGDIGGEPVFLRRVLPHFTWQDIASSWFAGDDFIDAEREWPLLSRGWVYQEQLLSRRMLHVTRSEFIWECSGRMDCECGWYTALDPEYTLRGQAKLPVASKSWDSVIEEYSKRDLTYGNDKLPALAGVAQAFHDSHGDLGEYWCGLWERDLEKSFFWQSTELRPSPQSGMPSWTWASVSGNVSCWSIESETVKFLGASVSYDGDNPFMGDVREGRVTLAGPLAPATLHLEEGRCSVKIGNQWALFTPDYALDSPGSLALTSGSPVYCLVFGEGTASSRDPEQGLLWERRYPCFLVLVCVDEASRVFQRIGLGKEGPDGNDAASAELDTVLGLAETQTITMT
ncbi:het domain-containingprotein [Purpureocillium lavendulum]|uniref:Het domain-containingprotein n=1 Tax=Purpureocillium lavendulum TaxID=1247861 RepID=A0AB34FQV2_9HYPO|nr:het domain-containingprotein [Purpureocillium lavendulum]